MLSLFNKIALEGSPSAKIQLLRSFPYQQELKTVLRLATDPFITFGITDFHPGMPPSDENHYHLLERLSHRELTGNDAKSALGAAISHFELEDQEVVRRILRKDLRCGVGEKLVLQLFPGLIRQFDVMRADKFRGCAPRNSYVIEPKYDGLRCLAFVEGGSVTLFSRNGNELTSSDHLKPIILRLSGGQDGIFDGELTSGNFNESSSAVRKKHTPNENTIYHVFDYLDMDEWKAPTKTYNQRRMSLQSAFDRVSPGKVKLAPSYPVSGDEQVYQLYNRFLDLGYEGGIIKNTQGLYRLKRHRDWMKLKEINDVDLIVESVVQGEGKYSGMLGALIGKFKNKKVSIGTGISDEQRKLWWDNPQLVLKKIMEVHYHQVTPDGSLRHPRLFCIREDKIKID